MNQKKTVRYANTTCFISQNEHKTWADTVADKHIQNIKLLPCINYRGDEALDVSNANNKGWTNFSRLRIILLIYGFKLKFYQIKWLWFLGSITLDNRNKLVLFPQDLPLWCAYKRDNRLACPTCICLTHFRPSGAVFWVF